MRQVGSLLWPRLRALQVYGANTGVGKTVVSTLLCKALRRRYPDSPVHYLKPVSTGPLDEADNSHISRYTRNISSKTLLQFSDPVSPHIAAKESREPIDDRSILTKVHDELASYVSDQDVYAIIETAGGVLSPAPSGSTQADFYRPLRLPVLLVGDHRLGGMGTTVSAWESLHIRGYDVDTIMLFEDSKYGNHAYLKEYFQDRGVATLSLQPPPEPRPQPEEDEALMRRYYEESHRDSALDLCVDRMVDTHNERLGKIKTLPQRAHQNIWHPFMQHTERSEKSILAIDSAYGDYFQTLTPSHVGLSKDVMGAESEAQNSVLQPAFDGSASWWTQGLGHGNPDLALTAAYTAGRYGHVMFGGAAHEPAVSLAETLLEDIGNPRLTRVFYTDNGSAGMEVAVKMALKAASKRYGWSPQDEVLILGLKGSYHGDTLGTMDCSEPSVYNTKVEWYRGRGYWFDFPMVKMQKGKWVVETPQDMEAEYGPSKVYDTLDEVFALRDRAADAVRYERFLKTSLERLVSEGKRFGALIMEPVILGAGGMLFADPLFQHSLVKVVRNHYEDIVQSHSGAESARHQSKSDLDWQGMPVVFDEIFTGLYRLGRASSSSFVDVSPDISAHAKLLTGGLLPMCTTLASESIYDAFLSTDKSDALLHGHSYTAHAVGCNVARHSLETMRQMDQQGAWSAYKDDWKEQRVAAIAVSQGSSLSSSATWSMWSKDFVAALSHRRDVEGVLALGCVLAISMRDPAGSGYTSTAGAGLRDRLLQRSEHFDQVVHSRVLGNVLYLMASLTAEREGLADIERMVDAALA